MVMTLITFKRDQTRSRSALVPTYNDGVILLLPHVDPGSHQIRVLRSDLQCHYTIKRSPIDYIAKQPPSHHYPQTTSESITNKMTEKSASFFEAAKVSHPAESPSRSQPPPLPPRQVRYLLEGPHELEYMLGKPTDSFRTDEPSTNSPTSPP